MAGGYVYDATHTATSPYSNATGASPYMETPAKQATRMTAAEKIALNARRQAISECQLQIDGLKNRNRELRVEVARLKGLLAEEQDARATAENQNRALKVQAEQTDAVTVLQEQITALEEERDADKGTITALQLAHAAEVKKLKSEKNVSARKDAKRIAQLERQLTEATAAEATAAEAVSAAPAADAGVIATLTEDGATFEGTMTESTYAQRRDVLNRAAALLVFTPTPQ